VCGDASLSPALHVEPVVPPWAAYLFAIPLKHAYLQGFSRQRDAR